ASQGWAGRRKHKTMRTKFLIRPLMFALLFLGIALPSFAQIGVGIAVPSFAQIGIGVSVGFAPPALPVYEQPVCPGDGYIWTPGYWAYAEDGGYYWVPGTWVEAPEVGFLWTPGYWGWGDGGYFWHTGYWGPHVGFYGGINYGFGYFGNGYEGGRWDGGHFFYNRSVNNVNVSVIHNVYNTRVDVRNENRVSFNGGNGGVEARATSQEESYEHERHIAPIAAQTQHRDSALRNPQLRASENHGKPPIAATARPNEFSGHDVVAAKEAGAPYKAPAERTENNNARTENNTARTENNAARPATAVHPKELPPIEHAAAPNTGNPKLDQKYQQQQTKLYNQQNQDREKLQAQQEKEHQNLAKHNAPPARTQQVEQKHQQQTQQMVQRHTQQQQHLQQRQQPAHESGAKPK
ncbi:MAG: YXWGXW repeat-containing protein, partial [Candidatus Acidiferrales bacterium]